MVLSECEGKGLECRHVTGRVWQWPCITASCQYACFEWYYGSECHVLSCILLLCMSMYSTSQKQFHIIIRILCAHIHIHCVLSNVPMYHAWESNCMYSDTFSKIVYQTITWVPATCDSHARTSEMYYIYVHVQLTFLVIINQTYVPSVPRLPQLEFFSQMCVVRENDRERALYITAQTLGKVCNAVLPTLNKNI